MTEATRLFIRKVRQAITDIEHNEELTVPKVITAIQQQYEGAHFAEGDECPYCNEKMKYDEGEPQTQWEPGQSESIFCEECGEAFAPDWEREEMKKFISAEEYYDPKDDGELTLGERNA